MKKFKKSWLLAGLGINLIILLIIIIFSFWDNLGSDLGIASWAEYLHDAWEEIAILEVPAFIIVNGTAIVVTVREHIHKVK